jgi:STE24 endopeptidase
MITFAIGLIVLTAMLRIWLELRQRACLVQQQSGVPPTWSNPAAMRRVIDGALRRSTITILGILAEAALALVLAIQGIGLLARSEPLASMSPVVGTIALSIIIMLLFGIIRKAVEATSVFFVDASIGLGRPPVLLFLRDSLAKLLVTSVVFVPTLIAAAVLAEAGVPMWGVLTWTIWLTLLTLDLTFRPFVQTRLFYAATPLRDETLASRIAQLLKNCGLELGSVEVLDASRRTRRANASVHGLGRQKHIYLHDTLIQRLGADEILAVVAHEAGHARLSHVQQYLAALAALGLAAALAISVLYDSLDGPVAERLAMIILLIPSASFCVRPILFKLSRRFEYEADAFAADRIGPQPMVRALEQLYASNAGVATADSLYALFHASHPVACQRLARLRLLECKTAAHSEPGVLMT